MIQLQILLAFCTLGDGEGAVTCWPSLLDVVTTTAHYLHSATAFARSPTLTQRDTVPVLAYGAPAAFLRRARASNVPVKPDTLLRGSRDRGKGSGRPSHVNNRLMVDSIASSHCDSEFG